MESFDEVTNEWRRLRNEKLYDLYSSPNTPLIRSNIMRWAGHVTRMEEAYKVLVVKPEGKRPLGGPRHRWEDNTKMDGQEVEWGMDWSDLVQYRDRWVDFVNAVINFRVP